MELISPKAIVLNSTADTQKQIFIEIATLAHQLNYVSDKEQFAIALAEREQQSSTGFGNIAIPHAKSAVVNQPAIIVLRTNHLIEWDAIDGEPVNCFICLMSPESGNNEHLAMISKLSRRLIYPEFVEFIKNEQDGQQIYAQLAEILHN